ncbi:MAG: uncharacterized protein A8A55_3347, partial [Amphiamblys sp. WSBS2006]
LIAQRETQNTPPPLTRMENEYNFASLFPKGTSNEMRKRAAVAAEVFTTEELKILIRQDEILLSSERPVEGQRIIEKNKEVLLLALEARKKRESLGPYARRFPFSPYEAGKYMPELNLAFNPEYPGNFVLDTSAQDLVSMARINLQVESLRMTYKELEGSHKLTERELHHHFHNFLKIFSREEKDVRSFFSLEAFEADILLGDSDSDTISIVEVKKDDAGDLEEELFKACLYAIKWCTMKGKIGDTTVNLAAVYLPKLMSRLGSIKVRLIPGREFEILSVKIYDLAVWGDRKRGEDSSYRGKCSVCLV